jgi:uncharacterized protein YdeI (YjbR/CyaY-like superfamily)
MRDHDREMKPRFFATPAKLRAWLETHHDSEPELVVSFYKKQSRRPSITWPESVDEALCFGWIDGIRRRVDDESYSIRFTPRKTTSTWSSVNVARLAELKALGKMRPAGLAAFEARSAAKSGLYAYENRHAAVLDTEQEALFRANRKAWKFFESQPPWYRKTAIWWVLSAKRDETRGKRLTTLIEESAAGRTIRQLTRTRPTR